MHCPKGGIMHDELKSMLENAKPYTPPTDNTDSNGVTSVVSVPGGGDWPDPIALKAQLLPVEPLSPEMIPAPYRGWTLDISHRMQSPIDMSATALIALTASVIGSGCRMRPKRQDNWTVTLNLYGALIGRPTVMLKSPTLTEALKPLMRLEEESQEEYDTANKYHAAKKEMFKAEKDALKDSMTAVAKKKASGNISSELLIEQYANMQEPEPPKHRRYRTNDASVEKLSELLAENPRGMLVFRDELSGLLATWEKEGRETDRMFFLEAWNGAISQYTDRIGRGTIHTKNVCVSIFGGIQPDKILGYLAMCRKANDGIFQRFQLLVYPDELPGWELVDERPNAVAAERVWKIFKRLSEMDFSECGHIEEGKNTTPYFHFAPDAQELFYEWLRTLELEKLRGNHVTDPMLLEHLGKYRKLMPALALIFHLIEIADGTASGHVTLASAERAAKWCDYLESHARRIYSMVDGLPMKAAQALLAKIKAGELGERFTLRDIYRRQWSMLTEREIVQAACDTLIAYHWLREESVTMPVNLRTRTEYVITPKLKHKADTTDGRGNGSIVSA